MTKQEARQVFRGLKKLSYRTKFAAGELKELIRQIEKLPQEFRYEALNGRSNEEGPLNFASFVGNVNVMQVLIEAGADVSKGGNRLKSTPLHDACSSNKPDAVKILLKQPNININVLRNDKLSALQLAVELGYEECAQLLLEAGAEIKQESQQDLLALAYPRSPRVFHLLIKQGHNVEELGLKVIRQSYGDLNKVVTKVLDWGSEAQKQQLLSSKLFREICRYSDDNLNMVDFYLNLGASWEQGEETDHPGSIIKPILQPRCLFRGSKVASQVFDPFNFERDPIIPHRCSTVLLLRLLALIHRSEARGTGFSLATLVISVLRKQLLMPLVLYENPDFDQ